MKPTMAVFVCLSALSSLCSGQAVSGPVRVDLDFSRYTLYLEGPDGASLCQFHDAKPDGSSATAGVVYSSLGGFPDDSSDTDFFKRAEGHGARAVLGYTVPASDAARRCGGSEVVPVSAA